MVLGPADLIADTLLVFRRGKKQYGILKFDK